MSLKGIIARLGSLAKNGKKKEYLELLKNNSVMQKASYLDAVDSSKLIYSFSMVNIQDKSSWNILEQIFLVRVKEMNMHDLLISAYGFARYSKNTMIWQKLEKEITSNFLTLRNDKHCIMGIYAFAVQNYVSEKLWTKLEYISLENISLFTEKEITIAIWSFSQVNKGSQLFWQRFIKVLENDFHKYKLQNMIIACGALFKSNHDNPKIFTKLKQSLYAETLQLSPKDLANLSWILRKINAFEPTIWQKLENLFLTLDIKFCIDLSTLGYSFQMMSQGSESFWKHFAKCVEKIKIDTKDYNQIVLLAFILSNQKINNQEAWNNITRYFIQFINQNYYHKHILRMKWHKCFFVNDPNIWNEKFEKFYLNEYYEIMANLKAKSLSYINDLIWMAVPELATREFWDKVEFELLKLLKSKEFLGNFYEEKQFIGRSMLCLMNAFEKFEDYTRIKALMTEFLNLCKDKNFAKEIFCSNRNITYLLYCEGLHFEGGEISNKLSQDEFELIDIVYLIKALFCKHNIPYLHENFISLSEIKHSKNKYQIIKQILPLFSIHPMTHEQAIKQFNDPILSQIETYIKEAKLINQTNHEIRKTWKELFIFFDPLYLTAVGKDYIESNQMLSI